MDLSRHAACMELLRKRAANWRRARNDAIEHTINGQGDAAPCTAIAATEHSKLDTMITLVEEHLNDSGESQSPDECALGDGDQRQAPRHHRWPKRLVDSHSGCVGGRLS